MFVIPLCPLRFDPEQINAGLRHHDTLFRADLGFGFEIESEAALRRQIFEGRNGFLAELAFPHYIKAYACIARALMRVHVRHHELEHDGVARFGAQHGARIQPANGRSLIGEGFLARAIGSRGRQLNVEVLGARNAREQPDQQ